MSAAHATAPHPFSAGPTTVAVLEDQELLSGALRQALDTVPDLDFVGSASTLADAGPLVERTHPDVLLSDYRLPDGDLGPRVGELLDAAPDTRVLVLTGWPDEASFLESISSGASGYLDKTAPFDDLLDAIRRVARGELAIAARFVPVLARRATHPDDCRRLSQRELEVLQLIANGHGTAEIADRLILSVNTVRNHVTGLLAKLGAHSRLEAVNLGVRQGLIRFEPPV